MTMAPAIAVGLEQVERAPQKERPQRDVMELVQVGALDRRIKQVATAITQAIQGARWRRAKKKSGIGRRADQQRLDEEQRLGPLRQRVKRRDDVGEEGRVVAEVRSGRPAERRRTEEADAVQDVPDQVVLQAQVEGRRTQVAVIRDGVGGEERGVGGGGREHHPQRQPAPAPAGRHVPQRIGQRSQAHRPAAAARGQPASNGGLDSAAPAAAQAARLKAATATRNCSSRSTQKLQWKSSGTKPARQNGESRLAMRSSRSSAPDRRRLTTKNAAPAANATAAPTNVIRSRNRRAGSPMAFWITKRSRSPFRHTIPASIPTDHPARVKSPSARHQSSARAALGPAPTATLDRARPPRPQRRRPPPALEPRALRRSRSTLLTQPGKRPAGLRKPSPWS